MYMDDLADFVAERQMSYHSFADDSQNYEHYLPSGGHNVLKVLKDVFLTLVTGCRQIVLNSMQASLSLFGPVPDTTSVCLEALVHQFGK